MSAAPCYQWTYSDTNPHAVLLCIHGLGLHGGMYRTIGDRLAKRGIATYALDVRGFGAWNRKLTCRVDLDASLNDIADKIAELRERHPGLPLFLLGESLGGAICARFAADCSTGTIDGLILSQPARSIGDHKSAVAKVCLSALLRPLSTINLSHLVTRYAPRLVAAAEERLARLHFSLGELLHLSRFIHDAYKRARQVRAPVLMLQGHNDRLISTRNTLAYFERLGSAQKNLLVLGAATHLIFQTHEPQAEALSVLLSWMSERAGEPVERQAV